MMQGKCPSCGYECDIPLHENAKIKGSQAFARSVVRAVARVSGVSAVNIRGQGRQHKRIFARAAVTYILREHGDFTLLAVGDALGSRDHSTILHYERRHYVQPRVKAIVAKALIDLELSA